MTWYALAVSSQYEDKIAEKLGPAAYVPKRIVWRKVRKNQKPPNKSGRVKKHFPLLPGYILVDLDLGDKSYNIIRLDRKVFGFVASGGMPLRIRDKEIAYLKARESTGHYDETKEALQKLIGGKFDIMEGPFEGKRIKVSSIKNNDLIMEIDGFPMPVTVSIASFEKIKHNRVE